MLARSCVDWYTALSEMQEIMINERWSKKKVIVLGSSMPNG